MVDIHPWQVLDGVVRGRTVVVLGSAMEPMPKHSMAKLSPISARVFDLVTSPALRVSKLALGPAAFVSRCNLTCHEK